MRLNDAVRLLLATRNAHKLREFARLLPGDRARCRCPTSVDTPPEDGDTYAANALIKARAAAAATGARRDRRRLGHRGRGARRRARRPHGALRGRATRPTARTSPSSPPRRPPAAALRYVCVIAHVDARRRRARSSRARATGTRRRRRRAASGGFGYDPLFVPDDGADGRTMAELTDAEKDAISHRGRAARALAEWLRDR